MCWWQAARATTCTPSPPPGSSEALGRLSGRRSSVIAATLLHVKRIILVSNTDFFTILPVTVPIRCLGEDMITSQVDKVALITRDSVSGHLSCPAHSPRLAPPVPRQPHPPSNKEMYQLY